MWCGVMWCDRCGEMRGEVWSSVVGYDVAFPADNPFPSSRKSLPIFGLEDLELFVEEEDGCLDGAILSFCCYYY